jgi:hypothetical protein
MHTSADLPPPWEELLPLRPTDVPQTIRWKAVAAFKRAGVVAKPQEMEWRTNRLSRHRGAPRKAWAAKVGELFFGSLESA